MEPTTSAPAKGASAPQRYVSLTDFLSTHKKSLTNALLPDVLPLLKKRGYTEAIINSKLADLEALKEFDQAQKKEYGEQYEATEKYHLLEDSLHQDYIDHIKLARMVFKNNPAAKTALGLKGKRKQSAGGYCLQALDFYDGALADTDYQTALATKGTMVEELTAGKTGFDALTPLAAKQLKETGEAQAATKTRDAKWDELDEWMGEFKDTAIIALRKHPQLREKLGYVEE